jgi:hypothetical protein
MKSKNEIKIKNEQNYSIKNEKRKINEMEIVM